jgi:hypothetical protein
MGSMTSTHFLFIPAVLLVGVVLGWIMGSRAARDAFAMELKRREERAKRTESRVQGPEVRDPAPGVLPGPRATPPR